VCLDCNVFVSIFVVELAVNLLRPMSSELCPYVNIRSCGHRWSGAILVLFSRHWPRGWSPARDQPTAVSVLFESSVMDGAACVVVRSSTLAAIN